MHDKFQMFQNLKIFTREKKEKMAFEFMQKQTQIHTHFDDKSWVFVCREFGGFMELTKEVSYERHLLLVFYWLILFLFPHQSCFLFPLNCGKQHSNFQSGTVIWSFKRFKGIDRVMKLRKTLNFPAVWKLSFQTLPSVVCTGPGPCSSRPFLDWQGRIDRPLLFPFKVNCVSNAWHGWECRCSKLAEEIKC